MYVRQCYEGKGARLGGDGLVKQDAVHGPSKIQPHLVGELPHTAVQPTGRGWIAQYLYTMEPPLKDTPNKERLAKKGQYSEHKKVTFLYNC